jgi:hypothetical protein
MLLGISERTAAIHANHAAHKLGCVSKHQAALKALRQGLIRRRTESRSYSIPGRQRHLPQSKRDDGERELPCHADLRGCAGCRPYLPHCPKWLALT